MSHRSSSLLASPGLSSPVSKTSSKLARPVSSDFKAKILSAGDLKRRIDFWAERPSIRSYRLVGDGVQVRENDLRRIRIRNWSSVMLCMPTFATARDLAIPWTVLAQMLMLLNNLIRRNRQLSTPCIQLASPSYRRHHHTMTYCADKRTCQMRLSMVGNRIPAPKKSTSNAASLISELRPFVTLALPTESSYAATKMPPKRRTPWTFMARRSSVVDICVWNVWAWRYATTKVDRHLRDQFNHCSSFGGDPGRQALCIFTNNKVSIPA
jgi:hypothetical protein